jgi:hypothetical protein
VVDIYLFIINFAELLSFCFDDAKLHVILIAIINLSHKYCYFLLSIAK